MIVRAGKGDVPASSRVLARRTSDGTGKTTSTCCTSTDAPLLDGQLSETASARDDRPAVHARDLEAFRHTAEARRLEVMEADAALMLRLSVEVNEALVRRLLAAQMPHLADRPLSMVEPWGTDNGIWRLGEDLVVRLPRIGWAEGQVSRDAAPQ